MLKRTSTAVWKGNGLEGKGALTTQSGVFKEQPYSFQTRFVSEDGRAGTNPEELIAAAHAGCFAMQLSALLGNAGFTPTRLTATAKVYLEKEGAGFAIPRIELSLEGSVPNISAAEFQKHAETAKATCPVSKALAGPAITLAVKLV